MWSENCLVGARGQRAVDAHEPGAAVARAVVAVAVPSAIARAGAQRAIHAGVALGAAASQRLVASACGEERGVNGERGREQSGGRDTTV